MRLIPIPRATCARIRRDSHLSSIPSPDPPVRKEIPAIAAADLPRLPYRTHPPHDEQRRQCWLPQSAFRPIEATERTFPEVRQAMEKSSPSFADESHLRAT